MSETVALLLTALLGGLLGWWLAGPRNLAGGEGRLILGPFVIFRSRDGEIGPGRSWVCWHSADGGLWMYNAEALAGLVRCVRRNWKKDSSLVG